MRSLMWAAMLTPMLACSDEPGANRGRVVESSAGTVELGIAMRDYRPGPVATGVRVSGVVTSVGTVADSIMPVERDATVCGDSGVVRQVRLNGTSLANALVWVDGVEAGKQLPENRRATVTIDGCRFDPRILATVAGTTINIFSRDRVTHQVNFYREGRGTPVASVMTMDAGQVVPTEAIARTPGLVEARCETHPWERGYLAVFDHPYFAVTNGDGAFTIEELPAGAYTVKVWHEGMQQPSEQRVTVRPGGAGEVQLQVALK